MGTYEVGYTELTYCMDIVEAESAEQAEELVEMERQKHCDQITFDYTEELMNDE